MRTIAALLLVLALGTSGAMLEASGFSDAWGAEPPKTSGAQEAVEDQADAVSPDQGPVVGPVNSDDNSIIGLVVDGLDSLVDLAGAVVLLPITLMNLGFPAWFAIPIGTLTNVIAGIGIIQWATQRQWK
jgi:hypothetical protein